MSTGDFETLVTPDGQVRILNCLPSDPARLMAAPVRSATIDLTTIKPMMIRPAWLKIKDQNGRGACVGHGSTRALEFVRALAGLDGGAEAWQELSAWDLYARLCGGWDRGANILDALTMLRDQGVALMASVPYGLINPNRIPAAAAAERPGYKIEIGERLDSFEAMAEAVAEGDGVSYSVRVGGGFNNLDAEGVPPTSRGPSNHCVFAGGELVWSQKHGLLLGSDNSWGLSWGLNGRFRLSEAVVQCQTYFEAWRVRAVTTPGTLPPSA